LGSEQRDLFSNVEPAKTTPAKKSFTLSPSEFGFLWQECKRCYYLRVTQKYSRPGAFPKIFTAIDGQMRLRFDGKRTEEVLPQLPPGKLDCADQRVISAPIVFPNRSTTLQIRGKLDALVRFDDGSFAVVDFKTSAQSAQNIETYKRQLNAYAYALENPAPGQLPMRPVRHLGLLVFEPRAFSSDAGAASFSGTVQWSPIAIDPGGFRNFLDEVATVLDLAAPPPCTPDCDWCKYREASRQSGY
jgi:PD-(D/E)XK nuclease superfamily